MVAGKQLRVVLHKPKITELERLVSLCAAGQLTPVIDCTYPLEKFQDAFARFASGQFTGKIVLLVDSALA
ncbi:zinc-binding dehydrogenase [Pelagibacterium montanilacus]|uniref:zinc-binding dehydrogenase n=1 Tax=Pelagibacterium montanilacus TaxID=2185280 RepID=UPI000F8D05FF|nr:zinc-binding dehydrogenase [Pelagibacterium montanilacus]